MSGAAAPPGEISEHLHDCAGCRSFVREWNRIELGLQSLRDQTPALSADFGSRLHARIQDKESRGERNANSRLALIHQGPTHASRLPFPWPRLWQIALAGGVTLILLILTLQLIQSGRLAGSGAGFAQSAYGSSGLLSREGAGSVAMPRDRESGHAGHGLETALPLANTH